MGAPRLPAARLFPGATQVATTHFRLGKRIQFHAEALHVRAAIQASVIINPRYQPQLQGVNLQFRATEGLLHHRRPKAKGIVDLQRVVTALGCADIEQVAAFPLCNTPATCGAWGNGAAYHEKGKYCDRPGANRTAWAVYKDRFPLAENLWCLPVASEKQRVNSLPKAGLATELGSLRLSAWRPAIAHAAFCRVASMPTRKPARAEKRLTTRS